MKKEKYDIKGMTCSACSSRVERTVAKLVGDEHVSVNLLTNSMQVEYDEGALSSSNIIEAVEGAGYGAFLKAAGTVKPETSSPREQTIDTEIRQMKERLIWSIVFLIPTMYIAMHHMTEEMLGLPAPDIMTELFEGPENAITFAFSQFLLILPIMYLNRKYYINGFRNLFKGSPNMDSLVGMGSMAAAVFGAFALFRIGWGLGHGDMALVTEYSTNLYFESAGTIVTLITLGKYLEAKAKGRTGSALKKLTDLAPKQAAVIRNGIETLIPVENLVIGDEVLVRPGERIPADGIITQGTTVIDESTITGESIPVEKQPGSSVISATINQSGLIRFTAKRVGEDSTISQMIRLVEEASASKAPIAKLADRIAGIFVPAVIAIAVIAGGFWLINGAGVEFAFSIAISILVISCPCALGLATPVAIMVGTGKGAENGILIKSGEALEIAQSIDTIVMDKTGTITEGRPHVTDVKAIGLPRDKFIALTAGIEHGSEHPLGKAVLDLAEKEGIPPLVMTNFHAMFGRGISAEHDGLVYFAGNEALMKEQGVDVSEFQDELDSLADEGKTPLLFARNHRLVGLLAAADTEKATSLDAIRRFRKMGMEVIMLTGDKERTAEAVRKRVGITQAIAGVTPESKAFHIELLQKDGRKVAMIGDGINDAPALAKADLGIAIGAGTDIAIESAGAVLMRNDLLDAVSAIRLSRAVMLNIKENLFWAFIYNIIGIPLAAGLLYPAFGIKLSPMIGAAAMSLSSVCVVMNALRLNFFNPSNHEGLHDTTPSSDTVSNDRNLKEASTMTKELKVEGMMCDHCKKHVTNALSKMEGVTEVQVNLETKTAAVTMNREISMEEFAKVIEEAGYELVK